MPAPGWAAAAEAAEALAPSGPWLFASVALVLVAAAAFAAGHWRARADRPQRPAAPGVDPAPPPPPPAAGTALQDQAAALEHDLRPMLLLTLDAPGGARRVARANAAALALLGGPAALGQPWSDLEAGAPPELRAALALPAAASAAPWWVLADAAGRAWLALGPAEPTDSAGDAALGYTVTHDLRAPIRVVEGFTRIVKEDYGKHLDRMGNDHLDRVLAAAARMNQMIDAMLAMARLSSQPLARQPVDLSQLAGFVVDELRRAAPERQAEVEIEPGLKVHGDPTLLRLVLENLLGNAWKYSAQCPTARITLSSRPHQGRRCFVVQDNGAGFDMRLAARLFGLFQRLHSAKDYPGTGVGLASVKRIVQRHGGEVWAESEPGRGAAFSFTLRE